MRYDIDAFQMSGWACRSLVNVRQKVSFDGAVCTPERDRRLGDAFSQADPAFHT